MKKYFSIALFILLSGFCNAQQAWTIYNSNTVANFPSNSVHCIAIDSTDIKWVGTDYGLAAFNDTTWTIYNTFNSGLTDNSIRSIAVDKFNNIWIGTFLGGLLKFDGDTTWTAYSTLNSAIPDDYVKTIAFDTSGNIWIGTTIGLVKFDGDTTWKVYNISNSIFTLSDNIADINIDASNYFRIGTINGGYLTIDDTIWTLYTIPNGSGIPDNTQLGIDVDQNGIEWLATPGNGLVAHPSSFTWSVYNQFTSQMPSSSASCLITKTNPDRIWVGTLDFGVVRKTGLSFTYFDMSNSPMPDVYVQCIANDANGIIWIGTQTGGLVKLDESQLTAVNEISSMNQLLIFPMPVKNELNIINTGPVSSETKIMNITMTDLAGKDLNLQVNESSPSGFKIDLQSLSVGIYFLQIQTADRKVVIKKILKVN